MMHQESHLFSRKRLVYSVMVVAIMLLAIWCVQAYVWLFDDTILQYGMRPGSFKGLAGIVTMPFLHSGLDHLVSNSVPLFLLGSGLFYFYRETAWKVLLWITLMTGAGLWFIGQHGSNHIGASGLVYGLVGFHLLNGFIRRNRNLKAFALLVVFLYGGFIWSLFPEFFPDSNISWEGHLSGLISGLAMALIYRKDGPQADPLPEEDVDDLYDTEVEWFENEEP